MTLDIVVNIPIYDTGITYDQLARTLDNFNGKRVTFTWTVV